MASKTIHLGSIRYSIFTEFEEGSFFGCWKNETTEHTGGSSKACDNEDEALMWGENNARADYGFKYGYDKDGNPKK